MESTHDRALSIWSMFVMHHLKRNEVVASRVYDTGLPEYIGREVAPMTTYEIVSIILAVASLVVATGMFVVALLTFLDKRNKRKK